MRNGVTGELIWEWEDPTLSSHFSGTCQARKKDNKVLLCSQRQVTCVNLDNGTALWKSEVPSGVCGKPRINLINDHVFHAQGNCNPYYETHLLRTSVESLKWDTIFSLYKENGYEPSFEMPSCWVKPTGDTILIFQNRSYNFSQHDGKIDLYALNLRTREIEWKINDLDEHGNSNVSPPNVWKDKIYFQGDRTVYCIDAPTGNVLWQHRFTGIAETLTFTNLLVIEGNKLIVKPGSYDTYAFDLLTGSIIWHNPKSGANSDDMVYHNGVIYHNGNGNLMALDAENGKVLLEKDSPFEGDFLYGGFSINPELGYLYGNDGKNVMCIKLLK
jgi:outer membrane protein assembly factor BamB